MFAPGNMTGDIGAAERAVAFIGHLTEVLGLLVLGIPLTPPVLRAMLVGWVLVAVAIGHFIVGRFQRFEGDGL
jgi:uncharacterized membrane protein HdeD (DUF308 family)